MVWVHRFIILIKIFFVFLPLAFGGCLESCGFFLGFWSGAPSLEEASDADTRGGKA
jgi:hypothetical protein